MEIWLSISYWLIKLIYADTINDTILAKCAVVRIFSCLIHSNVSTISYMIPKTSVSFFTNYMLLFKAKLYPHKKLILLIWTASITLNVIPLPSASDSFCILTACLMYSRSEACFGDHRVVSILCYSGLLQEPVMKVRPSYRTQNGTLV